jgi:hypothetical protein
MADRWWAQHLGVGVTHGAIVGLKLSLFALAFALAASWSLGNLYFVYRTIGSVHVPRRLGNLEFVEAVPRRYLLYGTVTLGLLLAVILSHGAGSWWYPFALLGSSVTGDLRDPVLDRDLGYYLFRLPWERTLHGYLTEISAVMLLVIAALYGLMGALRVVNRRLMVADAARTHLAVLLAAFGLALTVGFQLDPAEYVAGLRGVPYDSVLLSVRLPVSRALGVVALAVSLASVLWIWVDRVSVVVTSWGLLASLGLIGTFVVPSFAAVLRSPDRRAAPQLMSAQRRMLSVAFDLPTGDTTIDPPAVPDSKLFTRREPELPLAPAWHAALLSDLLDRTATAHSYERFRGLALDAYPGRDGRPVPAYVGAREIDLLAARQADPGLSWAAVHTGQYTHASGAVAVAASAVDARGLPRFLPDLAHPDSGTSETSEVPLSARDVFFGPAQGEYAVEKSDGPRGVPPGGLLRRLALAWALQSFRLLSTQDVPADASVLWHRAIADRLNRYAPFAEFGSPYPVIVQARLFWLAWGYVSAEAFPLSVLSEWRDRDVRYLRASLLGVVDAYSGETAVYLLRSPDPLSRAWAALAPDVVRPVDRLPAGLRQHVRYPDELFGQQVLLTAAGPPTGVPTVRPAPLAPAPTPVPSGAPVPGRFVGLTRPAEKPKPVWLVGTLPGDDTLRLRLRAVDERGEPALIATVIDGFVSGTKPELRVVRLAQPLTHRGPSQLAAESSTDLDPSGRVAGPVTTLVFGGGIVLRRSIFALGGEGGAPRLDEAIAQSDSATGRGSTPAAALRDLQSALRFRDAGAPQWGEARAWFHRLDEARRAGDWTAFGRAYEGLRRLLLGSKDSVP